MLQVRKSGANRSIRDRSGPGRALFAAHDRKRLKGLKGFVALYSGSKDQGDSFIVCRELNLTGSQ